MIDITLAHILFGPIQFGLQNNRIDLNSATCFHGNEYPHYEACAFFKILYFRRLLKIKVDITNIMTLEM